MRKKTLSKGKLNESEAVSPFKGLVKYDYYDQPSDIKGAINSPLGIVSPMPNNAFNARQSNVFRDCSGDALLSLVLTDEIKQISAQARQSDVKPSIDSILFGHKQTSLGGANFQAPNSSRDSIDSLG